MVKESVEKTSVVKKTKEIVTTEQEKGFVWYGVRVSFFLMIILWIVFAIISYIQVDPNAEPGIVFSMASLFWIAITIFNFVVSIIHLTKYDKKAFAIVSLVISSILVLLFVIGLGMSFVG